MDLGISMAKIGNRKIGKWRNIFSYLDNNRKINMILFYYYPISYFPISPTSTSISYF